MAFGFGELRLAPEAFWAMTPRELAAAADRTGRTRVAPPSHALMTRYPDEDTRDG